MLEIIFRNTDTTLYVSRALKMQLRAVNPIFYWDELVLQAERAWRQLYSTHPFFLRNTARQVHVWCNPFASRTFPSWQTDLRRKQYAAVFHSGASFSSISPRLHQFAGLGHLLQMGRTLYKVNFEQSKQETQHKSSFSGELVWKSEIGRTSWYRPREQPLYGSGFGWSLTQQPFSLWLGAPMAFHSRRQSLVLRRVVWARPGASRCFNVAALGLDLVWDLEH